MHLSLSPEREGKKNFLPLLLLFDYLLLSVTPPLYPTCPIFSECISGVIWWSPGAPAQPKPTLLHLFLALGKFVSWAALEEVSDDLAVQSEPQVIREGSAHHTSTPHPPQPLPSFKCQVKVKALRMHSLDFTTRQAGGAVPCCPTSTSSIQSLTSVCSLIFISLAPAFTAINNSR